MTTEHEALQSLINRAMNETSQRKAYLLIDSTKQINPSIDTESIKARWMSYWIINRKGAEHA